MIIRKATIKDLDKIAELLYEYTLYEQSLDKNLKKESLTKIKAEEQKHFKTGCLYFVVEEGKNIVGCLNANIDKRGKEKMGVIHNIIITKKVRGKGYGDKLVKYVLDYFKKNGCSKARTFVYIKNKKARDFWLKRGFDFDLGYGGSVKLK